MKKLNITTKKLITAGGIILVLAGLAVVIPTLYYRYSNSGSVAVQALSSAKPVKVDPAVPVISGQPVSISIPSVNISNPVIDGYYDQSTQAWTLTLDKAQFVTTTALPNNTAGNTFIYGHYRREVFAYLHLIKPGDDAVITTANGYEFTYQFESTYPTAPTDTSVLDNYQGPPMLTIQTCSGSFFQNRQMYLFKYVGYQKV